MDWNAIRSEFPVTRKWAFFDHGAVAPLSLRAQMAMSEWAADITENGDVFHSRWVKRTEEVRGMLGRLLNCEPMDVAFIKNTSEGVGIIAEGYPWQAGEGENVVSSEDEYPANVYPWMNLARRGVELRRVPSRSGRVVIDDLRKAIDSRTRIVSISWVEYASGFRNDLDAIGTLCREKGVLFFVDAIQGLGVFPIDVQKTPIDFLAADGHKWLLGPEGAGFLYVRRELVDILAPIGMGWNSVVGAKDFANIQFKLKPHVGRWESGSVNVAGIVGLGGSLELMLEVGIDKIGQRVLELTDHLCRKIGEKPQPKVFSSRGPGEGSGIVSIALPNPNDAAGLVIKCRDQGIAVNHRMGRLRASVHFYNSFEELDKLVKVMQN